MDIPDMTLDYIVAQDLIGKANALALLHGALASEGARLRAYLFTRRVPDTGASPQTVFQVKRCDWDGGSLIEVKEDNRVLFIAVPLDPYDTPSGPIVRHRGQRYQIDEYIPGAWTATLASEHARLCGRRSR